VQGDPVEVLPWLYIGNAHHAACEDRLRARGISATLNMADSPPRDDVTSTSGVDQKRLRHVNIAVADSFTSDISYYFPQAIDFIGLFEVTTTYFTSGQDRRIPVSVRERISGTSPTCPTFTKVFVLVAYGCGSGRFVHAGETFNQWLNYSARGGGSLQARGLKGRSWSPKG